MVTDGSNVVVGEFSSATVVVIVTVASVATVVVGVVVDNHPFTIEN